MPIIDTVTIGVVFLIGAGVATAWAAAAYAIAIIAGNRGRREWLWMVLGVAMSPLLAGLLLYLLPDPTLRRCSACARRVDVDAVFCRHCGRRIEPAFRPPRAL